MEHVGIDLHKSESQICRLTDEGEIIEQRIATRRDRFAAVLGILPRARILIEASTESEWVGTPTAGAHVARGARQPRAYPSAPGPVAPRPVAP